MSESAFNKSILIIKAHSKSLTGAEHFLLKRDWKIYSTTSFKEAFDYIAQHEPHFVFVCIDHANPQVTSLVQFIAKTFPVCVMAYTDKSSITAFTMLGEVDTQYKLYPPVTGPAIERAISKYYKDLQRKEIEKARAEQKQAEQEYKYSSKKEIIEVQGKAGHEKSPTSVEGGDAQSENATTASLNHVDGNSTSESIQGIIAKDNSSHNIGGLISPSESPKFNGSKQKGTPDKGPSSSEGTSKPDTAQPVSGQVYEFSGNRRVRRKKMTSEEVESHPLATKRESVVSVAATKALKSSVNNTNSKIKEELDLATNVACIVIDSSRFSGYLVTAMGKNKKIDDEFLTKIQERLFKFLVDNGEELNRGENMDLKIKQVPFEDWALEYAEFLRKSVHDGNEVAMAFFPRVDIKAMYEESHLDDMAAIRIDDLQEDVPIEFDAYIRLPKNDKYLLYTPRGGTFFGNQKERLKTMGISQLHIMKTDIQDVEKYRAQNFLNESIRDFEEKERQENNSVRTKKPA